MQVREGPGPGGGAHQYWRILAEIVVRPAAEGAWRIPRPGSSPAGGRQCRRGAGQWRSSPAGGCGNRCRRGSKGGPPQVVALEALSRGSLGAEAGCLQRWRGGNSGGDGGHAGWSAGGGGVSAVRWGSACGGGWRHPAISFSLGWVLFGDFFWLTLLYRGLTCTEYYSAINCRIVSPYIYIYIYI
jgi:hypothetical protein